MAQEHQHQAAMGYGEYSMQGYEASGSHELYNLQTRMEMLGFPSKHHHHHQQNQNQHNPETSWRSGGLFLRPGSDSPASESLMISPDAVADWDQPRQLVVDDSLRCLFPVHDEEQPSQGLSLSLYNPEPSVVVDSAADYHRSLMFSRPTNSNSTVSHQQGFSFHSAQTSGSVSSSTHKLRLSKYLIPTQELLNEFCDLGGVKSSKQKQQSKRFEEGGPSSLSPVSPSLQNLDILELQKRKAKLLTLLEEVDRKYRRYCEQMRAVVSSFESVAGEGSATTYLALASKAMSRHFRSLRDGIVSQIQAAKKTMGEKDPIAPGISRGDTPRLKLLDQCFRQQKAFQQGGLLMEQHPWRPQRGLPERSVSILRAWLFEHFLHPYPSDVDKHILARQTGLSRSQVSNWFINARVRLWKPMIEEMYTEELKEREIQSTGAQEDDRNPNPSCSRDVAITDEQKPLAAELLTEPDSLSSIINHHSEARPHHTNPRDQIQLQRTENFGIADLHFSSYNGCGSQSYSGNGVSLTLGLQHHDGSGGGGGMGFSLSPTNPQPLFYSRGQMEECQPVQFSILDGEVQNLPYRNLMGAQLLHDLAG
ncbi:homeobox protein BEL1 homolog [Dendrobium catenatum]|uniref:Homeobox protein BEL1 like n=1 Tax=Dendrobium catenatum TaxID=906689 RepID=A0A2I0X817_9ASPA|nr:homeobox protein BEL1 homolog [Dendrobium catenatum]PKU84063.1 Homeobox protein BEL1 like [Dendrobium catenatum]